jgi:RNA polymerase sigma factor (sigma-70 family)
VAPKYSKRAVEVLGIILMGARDPFHEKAMAKEPLENVLDYIRQIAGAPGSQELTDQELLHSFAADRDEAAFAVLVQRHGPLVWGVCRRVLRQTQDAEDAFQATFLVLARKAGRIRWQPDVSNWLYAVAWRVALKAKSDANRRQQRTRELQDMQAPETNGDSVGLEIRPVLDEELNRLPLKYRAPVVLHYLQGKTYAEAAEKLGWPAGTVSTRLAQARQLLRRRLARRGIGMSMSLLTAALAENAATAMVPPSLLDATVKAATLLAAGQAGTVISTKVLTLTQGALKAMFLAKLKTCAAVVLALGILGTGAGFVGYRMLPGVEAKGPANANPNTQVVDADPPGDDKPKQEIDRLRQENDELRKELRALRDKVTDLERKLPKEQATSQVTFQGKPVDYWLNMFKDRDPGYRQNAIHALAAIGTEDKRVIPALIGALKDSQVDSVAADALGSIGRDAVPSLLELLKGKDNELRAMAAIALARMGRKGKEAIPETKDAIPLLIKCLDEDDQFLRSSAAHALGQMAPESKSAIPALIQLLKDESPDGRQTSFPHLGHVRDYVNVEALSRFGKDAVPLLTEALKDPNENLRISAAVALARIGEPAKSAVPELIRALHDKHNLVRENASVALAEIGVDAVPAVVELMQDKDPAIRTIAVETLGRMSDYRNDGRPFSSLTTKKISGPALQTAVQALLKAMGDRDEHVRKIASQAYAIYKERGMADSC